MKLTEKAIQAIKDAKNANAKIALALGCSVYTVDRYLKDNDDSLTKAAALAVIRKVTGLKSKEILEPTIGAIQS